MPEASVETTTAPRKKPLLNTSPSGRAPEKASKQKAKAEHSEQVQAAAAKQLPAVAREIAVRLEKADKLSTQFNDHRLAAALKLKEAEVLCARAGLKFKEWAGKNLPQSWETSRKLLAVAKSSNPQLAIADMRIRNAEANAKLRQKKKETVKQAEKIVQEGTTRKEVERAIEKATPLLQGFDAVKAAFSALRPSEQVDFVTWAAAEIGVKVTSEFLPEAAAVPAPKQTAYQLKEGLVAGAEDELLPAQFRRRKVTA